MMKTDSRKGYVPDGIRDDTCPGMPPLGDVFRYGLSTTSELQLHEVRVVSGRDAARRPRMWRRKFADGHGGFVAGVAPDTVYAVFLYLVG
jgi:hypothetical protein